MIVAFWLRATENSLFWFIYLVRVMQDEEDILEVPFHLPFTYARPSFTYATHVHLFIFYRLLRNETLQEHEILNR